MKKQTIYVIAGPTACGKSQFALKLATEKQGQIVNADAFQVYQGLKILTARPSKSAEKKISHFLYGYADNQTQVSVFDWLKKIQEVVPSLSCPIIVGGTGLYLSALIDGISPMPSIPAEIRQKVRQMSPEERVSLLKNTDYPVDPQRQKRALEVLLTTKKPITYFNQLPKQCVLQADFKKILLMPPRELIYQRCADRLEQMIQQGAINEVQNLLQQKATGGVMKAIGVPELTQYLQQTLSLEQAQQKILLATRHYAKRQMTWFRHQYQADYVLQNLSNVITL